MRLKKCPGFEEILDYVQNVLPETQFAELQDHFEKCANCQLTLADAQELITFLQAERALEVSVTAHNRAIAMFQPWYRTRQNTVTPSPAQPFSFKKWVATLIMDTRENSVWNAPALAGLRNASAFAEPYQLLYSADNGRVEIDLQLQPAAGKKGTGGLIGQVVGVQAQPSTCRVELVAADYSVQEATPDETYTFRFSNIPSGLYFLNIYSNDQLFEIPIATL